MKYAFIATKRMTKTSKLVIEQANEIIGEMAAQGYTLTLRQLYYAFVTRGFLENKQENYKRLGGIIDEGRKQGLIDWDAFEDRQRRLDISPMFIDAPDYLRRSREWQLIDPWKDQDNYCEVWIEKEALVGVIARPCDENRVGYFACKGYASTSALYEAGRRLRRKINEGKHVTIFHLGDHDPSGIDMTRNNREMLELYAQTGRIEVKRLAMHMSQIEEFDLPPNPAKESDSRFAEYQSEYGDSSWELDALEPAFIEQLVTDSIDSVCDRALYDEAMAEEEAWQDDIRLAADNWEDVMARLKEE